MDCDGATQWIRRKKRLWRWDNVKEDDMYLVCPYIYMGPSVLNIGMTVTFSIKSYYFFLSLSVAVFGSIFSLHSINVLKCCFFKACRNHSYSGTVERWHITLEGTRLVAKPKICFLSFIRKYGTST